MSRPVRILHLADSHVGAGLSRRPRLKRQRRGDDLIDSYRRVLARAFEHDVDLVIHAGDVFDKAAPGDGLVTAAAEPLLSVASAGIPVIIVPGNHERSSIPASLLLAHERIHIVREPVTISLRIRDFSLAVAAIPCIRRLSAGRFRAALEQSGWQRSRGDINLLAVHQTFESAVCGPSSYRFRSGDDVIQRDDVPRDIDYVAAGHIHRHQTLDSAHDGGPPIVYSGSCDRVSFAEIDEPKGCVLIEIDAAGALTHRFTEHAVRPMVTLPIDLSGLGRKQVLARIMASVEALPPNAVASLRLSGKTSRRDVRGLDIHRRALAVRPDVALTSAWRAVDFVPERSVARAISSRQTFAFRCLEAPTANLVTCSPQDSEHLPAQRGVYAMHDAEGRLLYVGKAANLRARVRTHIRGRSDAGMFNGWTSRIARIEARPAYSELEALLVEADLIRRLQPPFNSRMRSWKRYCYLCQTGRPYSQLEICRDAPTDVVCFGPYSSRMAAEDILEAVSAEFGTARCLTSLESPCRPTLFPEPSPADLCARYFDGRCAGPCGGRISEHEYQRRAGLRDALLSGCDDSAIAALESRIVAAGPETDEQALREMERRAATLKTAYQRGELLREAASLLGAVLILPSPGGQRIGAHLSAAGLRLEPVRPEHRSTIDRWHPHDSLGNFASIPKSLVDMLCTAVQELRRHPNDYVVARMGGPQRLPRAHPRHPCPAVAGVLL